MPTLNGRRGWGLIFIGVAAIVRGYAYAPGERPSRAPGGLDLLSTYVPLSLYAAMWCITGLLCIVQAFSPPRDGRHRDILAITALVVMLSLWGYAYLASWLLSTYGWGVPQEPSREYLNAVTYLGPAFLIWAWAFPSKRSGTAVAHG